MAHRVVKIGNNFNLCIQNVRFLVLRTFVRFAPVRSFHTNIIVLSYFRKILTILIFSFVFSFSIADAALSDYVQISSSSNGDNSLPVPDKMGLPFESSSDATMPIVKIIKEAIKYVGLLAILALSWGGIQFLTSIGNDEKAKHAKHTIIYALVGVLLSVVAYTIVDIVNSLRL
ncbi:hypothetical protein GW819_01225 [Candidatus Gracilibacteria bacterium]|nr:hypothetical protein [Candidatus Gracilibacteria bacterium]PIQ12170.1 MAG: hypothetical protein COW68_00640 [Candidatus Gracilibacteria bacterium CG18_big_fil_WC_8_21_14_2_50_38_16]PIQ41481.1 MAG: hypothetical protein COW06_02775 [Candidatus Gracilibacteria bacterium CG12_big_fil_rev_8_21_14_0_65_38_15]PIZ01787.1 MAG: hypothetical protein COY60_01720 [Candidatus Gracilibacteria bacterium CG_4_10_14_0_8_um_filter_38_28]PJC56636.1 MAG: hypothetical protein CO024_02045 [Candidatus Gracilibacter